jgi:cytochrome oxidase Cu insertion factor (SCO1/SenC/PrrC family)
MSDKRRTQRGARGKRIRISATGILLTAAAIVGPAAVLDAGAGSNAVDPRHGNPEAGAVQAAVEVGSEAPDINLESIDGDSLRLSDLEGDKNVILVFFRGTW